MREWSKWWKKIHINIQRDENRKIRQREEEEKEELMEKEKQEEARKKYNEEVYQWYMRRRGKAFTWKEEAEKKLQARQGEFIYEVIRTKKMLDRPQMEALMRPIIREEKNVAQKQAKAQARIKQADAIFRATVVTIFPHATTEDDSTKTKDDTMDGIHETIDYYFGTSFDNLAEEQLDFIQRSPWHFDSSEILDKYDHFRVLFNDRRRKRNKALRWLRKKLRDELIQGGHKIHIRRGHKDRYKYKKIKRRQGNIEWLRNMYGDDYNVYWDVVQPCRRFSDRKFRYVTEILSGVTSSFNISHFEEDGYEKEEEERFSDESFFSKMSQSVKEESTILDIFTKEQSIDKVLESTEVSIIPRESVFSKVTSRVSASLLGREPVLPKKITSLSEIKPAPSPLTFDRLTALTSDVGYTIANDDNLMNELDYISQPVTQPDHVTRARVSQLSVQPTVPPHGDDVDEGHEAEHGDDMDEAEFTDKEYEDEMEGDYMSEEDWEDIFSDEGVEGYLEGMEYVENEYNSIRGEEKEEGEMETMERILEKAEADVEKIEDQIKIVLPENDDA